MRPVVWLAVVLFAVAMLGVRYAAHEIVGAFGIVGALVTVAAIYGIAVYSERRR